MNANQIAAVTISNDLHADIVLEKVSKNGGRFFRLNLDHFPADYDVSIQHHHAGWRGEIYNRLTAETLTLEEAGAFWVRKKGAFSFNAPLSKQETAFAVGEMEHLLFGLYNSCDCYWMSHPSKVRGAIWKLEQLRRAREFGFATPKSIVASSPQDVQEFRAHCKYGAIFKTLSGSSLAAETVGDEDLQTDGLKTTFITEENDALLGSLNVAAGFFQEYIPKALELRVTIVGHRAYAAEIHSQDDPRTAIDYRDFTADIKYDVANLPDQLERLCIDYVRSYGLEYGALDLIVTPAGDYVFLENNPVGQFYFIEQLVPSLAISDAIAARLIEEANKASR